MKRLKNLYIVIVLLFVILIVSANIFLEVLRRKNENASNLLMNRAYHEVQELVNAGAGTDAGDKAFGISEVIRTYHASKKQEWEREYGERALPRKVYFLPASTGKEGVALINQEGTNTRLWALYQDDAVIGFMAFDYAEGIAGYLFLLNAALVVAFFLAIGVVFYVHVKVLRPFGKLADYPERLSKNQISEKLPETRNRLFGSFIWGINMLNDKMTNDRRRIRELSREHLTMVTTIAHGIKTPVANIKLYADAIESGLYQPDGKANPSDGEVAGKIKKNADDVTELVKKLIDKASSGVVDFEPNVKSFYLGELKGFLDEEYGRRLELLRIPYACELSHNAMIKSDKDGICRILSQLMENAIKYGNGQGIHVTMGKDADGYHFSVKNRGEVLNESELPYVFHSFWRGSNAKDVEGSGIGLFEAREIARRLEGDIFVRTDPKQSETEFYVFLPETFQGKDGKSLLLSDSATRIMNL